MGMKQIISLKEIGSLSFYSGVHGLSCTRNVVSTYVVRLLRSDFVIKYKEGSIILLKTKQKKCVLILGVLNLLSLTL